MKKCLALILIISITLCFFTACGALVGSSSKSVSDSPSDKVVSYYKTLLKTNDTAKIRSTLSEFEKLITDETFSENERMFAKYSYNVGYGIVKLALSGKAISAFDFPEMDMLNLTVGAIYNGELEIDEVMISEAEAFVKKVEEFLK